MSFSRLLLVAANSKKYIRGEGNDKVHISPKISETGRDPYEGEVVLCFQLDERDDRENRVARSLGLPEGEKCCDGLVFYSQDEIVDRVICLVEMKSTNVDGAASQIDSTKRHLEELLRKECEFLPENCRRENNKLISNIKWKACIYHHGASPDITSEINKLKKYGFRDVDRIDHARNDLRPLLTGESTKDMAQRIRVKHGKRR